MEWAVADITNLVLPDDCRVCGAALVVGVQTGICQQCLLGLDLEAGLAWPSASVPSQQDRPCTRCGEALGLESARFAQAHGITECAMCRLVPPPFARAVAYAGYDDALRELLHQLKFSGQRELGQRLLGGRLARAILLLEPDAARQLVVVPVPLFPRRERERGFNQAELLARAAIRQMRRLRPSWRLQLEVQALRRVRDTRSSYDLNPRQRRRNVAGAFRIHRAETIRGREVLLIDDILTTGATAGECARVLLRAGATRVWVATAARAQPAHLDPGAQAEVAFWPLPQSPPNTFN